MDAATGAAAAAAMAAFVESLISLQVLKRLLSLLVTICKAKVSCLQSKTLIYVTVTTQFSIFFPRKLFSGVHFIHMTCLLFKWELLGWGLKTVGFQNRGGRKIQIFSPSFLPLHEYFLPHFEYFFFSLPLLFSKIKRILKASKASSRVLKIS